MDEVDAALKISKYVPTSGVTYGIDFVSHETLSLLRSHAGVESMAETTSALTNGLFSPSPSTICNMLCEATRCASPLLQIDEFARNARCIGSGLTSIRTASATIFNLEVAFDLTVFRHAGFNTCGARH
jgi:hypothetical protein